MEIKTKQQGTIEKAVNDHYHQYQFTMFTNNCDRILIIIYIIESDFQVIILKRDDYFIQRCLPMLEYSYYRHLIPERMHIDYNRINGKIHSNGYLKFNSSIEEKPKAQRGKRTKDYTVITDKFIKYADLNQINTARHTIKEEQLKTWVTGELFVGIYKFETLVKKIPKCKRVQYVLDLIIRK